MLNGILTHRQSAAEVAAAQKEARSHIDLHSTTKLVRDKMMDYLNYNSYHLPMYARPGLTTLDSK